MEDPKRVKRRNRLNRRRPFSRKLNCLVSHLRWYSKNVSALIAIRWQQTYWRFPFSKFQRQKREIDRLERELGIK